MKVLIVDDSPSNLKLLRVVLESENYQVVEASDGLEALAALEREPINAVISDILMPRMDGYRLCYEVRKNERLQALPFIFYTATYTSPSDEKLCHDLGGDKYLQKPASAEMILRALKGAATNAWRSPPDRIASVTESYVMKEYSERLVSKLEAKNVELAQAKEHLEETNRELTGRTEELERARAELEKINGELDQRVRQRTEELEASNLELEAFSYSVSHDLRAPVRAIGGFAHMVQEKYAAHLPPEAHKKLDRIHQNAIKMGQLIDGLLAFSRLSRQPLNKRKISPGTIVNSVLEELQPEQAGRRVKITVADLPPCEADPTLLQQVFANLLSNALKYSRGRDPAVIEVGARDGNAGCVYFVKDNGAGFEMEYAHKLFGVFQRLHRADQFEGTGVGLAIVQRIVNRHGGRVWAEAEPDKGAVIYFTLGNANSHA